MRRALLVLAFALTGTGCAQFSGQVSTSVATPPAAQATSAQPVATDTSPPLNLSSSGSVPAELSSVPVPIGFKVVANSDARVSTGEKFAMATVRWFGKSGVAEVGAFYKQAMPAEWTEISFVQVNQGITAAYASKKDPKLNLAVTASKTDAGTEVEAVLTVEP